MITRETVLAAFAKRLADDPLVSAEWHAFARADLAATLAKSGRAPDEAVRAFADKREGQCGGLALNAAPAPTLEDILKGWKLIDAERKRVFAILLYLEIKR